MKGCVDDDLAAVGAAVDEVNVAQLEGPPSRIAWLKKKRKKGHSHIIRKKSTKFAKNNFQNNSSELANKGTSFVAL